VTFLQFQVVFLDDEVVMCFRKAETQIGDEETKETNYDYNQPSSSLVQDPSLLTDHNVA